MTVAATISRDSVSSRVTTKENLVTLIGGIWLTAGLFIDGYAHSNIIKMVRTSSHPGTASSTAASPSPPPGSVG